MAEYDIQDLEVETLDTDTYEDEYEDETYEEVSEFGDYSSEEAAEKWGELDFQELLAEMANFVATGRKIPFFKKKRIVDGKEIDTLSQYMQDKFPSEFDKSRAIIADKDRIIAEAQAKAEATISSAKAAADDTKLRADNYYSEITAKAQADAQQIIAQAQAQAHEMMLEHSITRMAREESDRIKQETSAHTQQMVAAATAECTKLRQDTIQYCASIAQAAHKFVNNGLSNYQSVAKSSLDSISKIHTSFESEFATQMSNLGLIKK